MNRGAERTFHFTVHGSRSTVHALRPLLVVALLLQGAWAQEAGKPAPGEVIVALVGGEPIYARRVALLAVAAIGRQKLDPAAEAMARRRCSTS